MSDLFDSPADATPVEPDERNGLLQSWINYLRAADRHDLGPLIEFARL